MKLVIFDWNGTLFLDGFIWIVAHQKYCEKRNLTAPDSDTLAQVIFGADNHDFIGRLDAFYTKRGITIDWKKELPIFKEIYKECSSETPLHPFAKSTITALLQRDTHVHLLSASRRHDALPHIKRHSINQLIGNCAITLEREDKVTAIHEILLEYGVDPNDACMVGDTAGDIHSANDAGITSVGLRTRHVPADVLRAAKPNHFIPCLSQVIDIAEGHQKQIVY